MKTTTQTKDILNHLAEGERLTAIDALKQFHCFRLAARIADLRNEGWDIRTRMIDINGKRLAEYRLGK